MGRFEHKDKLEQQEGLQPPVGMNSWDRRILGGPSAMSAQNKMVVYGKTRKEHTIYNGAARKIRGTHRNSLRV